MVKTVAKMPSLKYLKSYWNNYATKRVKCGESKYASLECRALDILSFVTVLENKNENVFELAVEVQWLIVVGNG